MRLTLLCTLLISFVNAEGQVLQFVQKSNFPSVARYESVGLAVNGKGYFGTGANFTTNQLFSDWWEYDPVADAWTQKANFIGSPRYGATGFVIGNKAYVGTGWDPSQKDDFFSYDVLTNNWASIASFSGSARYDAFGVSTQTTGYVGFGYTPVKNDVHSYNPASNSWNLLGTLFPGIGRQSCGAFVLGNNMYVTCGASATVALNDTWRFDQNNSTWTQVANFPGTARWAPAYGSICQNGIIGSGRDATLCFDDYYAYDQITNTWIYLCDLPNPKRNAGDAFSINNDFYTGLGRTINNVYLNDFWKLQMAQPTIQSVIDSCLGKVSFSGNPVGAQNYTWYFGDGNSSNASAVAHTYTQAGTYHVQLIVNHLCFTDTTDTWVTVNTGNTMNVQFSYLLDTCASTLHFTPNDTLNNHLWDFGDGNTSNATSPTHTYASFGSFVVTHSVYNVCDTLSVNMPVVLNQIVPVVAQFETSFDTCTSQLNFVNTSEGGTQHVWYIGNDTILAFVPQLTLTESGNLPITLVTINACYTDSAFLNYSVPVLANVNLFIPNAFSPNDDGMNDFFKINNNDVCNPYKILIFNRWGEKLYDATSADAPWDGRYKSKPCPAGLYYYAVFFNNEVKRGPVMLLK